MIAAIRSTREYIYVHLRARNVYLANERAYGRRISQT